MQRTVAVETHAFRLARKNVVSLQGAIGMELRVNYGLVWLTEEGDTRDVVLGPGQSFRLERNGRVVIEVFAAAEILLLTRARPARPRPLQVAASGITAAIDLLHGALQAAQARGARISHPTL